MARRLTKKERGGRGGGGGLAGPARRRLYQGQITAAEIKERQSDNRTTRVKREDERGREDGRLRCIAVVGASVFIPSAKLAGHSLSSTSELLSLTKARVHADFCQGRSHFCGARKAENTRKEKREIRGEGSDR